jgi:hypothetical protein
MLFGAADAWSYDGAAPGRRPSASPYATAPNIAAASIRTRVRGTTRHNV